MEDILILAIDIGNTNIVVGCIRGDEVLFTERLSTNTTHTTLEYAISFKNVLEIYQIDAKEIEGAKVPNYDACGLFRASQLSAFFNIR